MATPKASATTSSSSAAVSERLALRSAGDGCGSLAPAPDPAALEAEVARSKKEAYSSTLAIEALQSDLIRERARGLALEEQITALQGSRQEFDKAMTFMSQQAAEAIASIGQTCNKPDTGKRVAANPLNINDILNSLALPSLPQT